MIIGALGGSGQVGTALRELCSARGQRVSVPSSASVDITDAGAVEGWLDASGVDAVVNCAAYTAVGPAEQNPDAANLINGQGAGHVARACAARTLPLLHLSTDYVFDGRTQIPYDEAVEPAPLNVYGASKLAGERAVHAAFPAATVLRVSWVYSPTGNNFVKAILKQAMAGNPLKVVDDQVGSPCAAHAIAEVACTLLERVVDGPPDEGLPPILHCASRPYASWWDFAVAICRGAAQRGWLDAVPEIERGSTGETTPPRPASSRLDATLLENLTGLGPFDWKTDLERVLDRIDPAPLRVAR